MGVGAVAVAERLFANGQQPAQAADQFGVAGGLSEQVADKGKSGGPLALIELHGDQ